ASSRKSCGSVRPNSPAAAPIFRKSRRWKFSQSRIAMVLFLRPDTPRASSPSEQQDLDGIAAVVDSSTAMDTARSMVQDEFAGVDERPQGIVESGLPVLPRPAILGEALLVGLRGKARQRRQEQLLQHLIVGLLAREQLLQAALLDVALQLGVAH